MAFAGISLLPDHPNPPSAAFYQISALFRPISGACGWHNAASAH
jgi:hypothetical protein